MPTIKIDKRETSRWEDALVDSYEQEQGRTGTHVSDLTLCLRQPVLLRDYMPEWSVLTLFRFTLGRALEKAVFKMLLPNEIQEFEVKEAGIEGHIDFGAHPQDYECKLTWSKPPREAEDLFESKFWWFEQMAVYSIMRRRTKMRLAVLHLFPTPQLDCYRVEWTKEELSDIWQMFLARKKHVEMHMRNKTLPPRTPLTWLCDGCPVNKVCYAKPN